jgi:S-phase kinase-associated protein 1
MENISLMSKEGAIRVVKLELAKMALTLKDMIESSDQQNSDESKPIPLTSISGHILDKIIEWLQYHYDYPIEEKDSDDEDNYNLMRIDGYHQRISGWDRKFFDVDRETLFELILAANFLNIKGLFDIGCKTAANQIKGKSAEEVRKLWNIECDLTPEEEKKLKKENAWTEEK